MGNQIGKVIGGAIGGPVGAVVGGIIGGGVHAGVQYHNQKRARKKAHKQLNIAQQQEKAKIAALQARKAQEIAAARAQYQQEQRQIDVIQLQIQAVIDIDVKKAAPIIVEAKARIENAEKLLLKEKEKIEVKYKPNKEYMWDQEALADCFMKYYADRDFERLPAILCEMNDDLLLFVTNSCMEFCPNEDKVKLAGLFCAEYRSRQHQDELKLIELQNSFMYLFIDCCMKGYCEVIPQILQSMNDDWLKYASRRYERLCSAEERNKVGEMFKSEHEIRGLNLQMR